MMCQILFSRKNKKIFQNVVCRIFMQSVKEPYFGSLKSQINVILTTLTFSYVYNVNYCDHGNVFIRCCGKTLTS